MNASLCDQKLREYWEVNRLLTQKNKLRNVLNSQLDGLKQALVVDFAGIALYDAINLELRWRLASGSLNDRYSNVVVRNDKGICGKALQTKRTFVIADFPADKADTALEFPILIIEELKSAIGTPMIFNEQLIGVLLVGTRKRRQFVDEDIKKVETVAADVLATYLKLGNSANAEDDQEFEEASLISEFFVSAKAQYNKNLQLFLLDQRITRISRGQQLEIIDLIDTVLVTIFKVNQVQVKCYCAFTSEEFISLQFEINQYFELAGVTFSDLATKARKINGRVELNCEKDRSELSIRFRSWV